MRNYFRELSLKMRSKTALGILFCLTLLGLPGLSSALYSETEEIAKLAEDGKTDEAIELLQRYLKQFPKSVNGRLLLGNILVNSGRTEEAIAIYRGLANDFDKLTDVDSNSAVVTYNNLAVLYARERKYDDALKALELAIKTHPSYATAHENLGDLYARMASEAYDRALSLGGEDKTMELKLKFLEDVFAVETAGTALAKSKPAAAPIAATTLATANSDTRKTVERPAPNSSPTDSDELLKALNGWSNAWSSQDVPKYLSFYSKSFAPAHGQSRNNWSKERAAKINRPKFIQVTVSDIEITFSKNDTAKIQFLQAYYSNSFSDSVKKTLVWKKEGKDWYIVAERT
jgi:tetratricopeptide (TPR) repeat protein